MNCINCKKKLKKGEFVTLNGGAMVKTKTGATMGGKNLIGFLTINTHFDSTENYRSMSLGLDHPNGQFEFYACTHKCLAGFLTKHIMNLEKLNNIKKFEIAPQSKLEKVGLEWCDEVVKILGFEGSMITDESMISDFLSVGSDSEKELKKINKKFGFKINGLDYIWKVAKNYKSLQM